MKKIDANYDISKEFPVFDIDSADLRAYMRQDGAATEKVL